MNEGEAWLRFAREDLRIAELAMQDSLYNQVCFHSQQCVEKALKGWLAQRGKSIPRTHRMADLLNIIPARFIRQFEDSLLVLDQFYIPTRYPDALPGSLPDGLPEESDAREALDLAKAIFMIIERNWGDNIGK